MRYEMIREIFNSCSNNQMRDVYVTEVETDDPAKIMEQYQKYEDDLLEREETDAGVIFFNLYSHGLRQRFTFTPDD